MNSQCVEEIELLLERSHNDGTITIATTATPLIDDSPTPPAMILEYNLPGNDINGQRVMGYYDEGDCPTLFHGDSIRHL